MLETAPVGEPLSLAQLKAHLRVTHDDDDDLITAMGKAAREHIDGPLGWLGRCLVQQTWNLKLDCFPALAPIDIPVAPLISVDAITYRDANGDSQTLATSVYQVVNQGARRSFIALEPNKSWPGTDDRHDAVTVQFTAGYAPGVESPVDYGANVPAGILAALKLMVGDLYENREARNVAVSSEDNPTVRRLLMPYRVSWF